MRMLPAIVLHARVSFRYLNPEARAECMQNCIANAAAAYKHLYEQGKAAVAFPSALAKFAVRQTKDHRVVGGHLCINDISSAYCQQKKGVVVERIDHFDDEENQWCEILVEDHRCGPFDIVRTKLDFAAWLRSLPLKLRRIARFLATGERTSDAARKFGLSEGRISQLRRELAESWRRFVGEEPSAAVA